MVGTTTNREREKVGEEEEEVFCDVSESSLTDCIEDELVRDCLGEVWATRWRETLGVELWATTPVTSVCMCVCRVVEEDNI